MLSMLSTSDLNNAHIQRHYENQKAVHLSPFILTAASRHARLSLETMYDFCHKGCAMYITAQPGPDATLTERRLLDMFDHLYGLVGQKQMTDMDLLRGRFPCKFIASWTPNSPREVGDILAAHRDLCAQVRLRQKKLDAEDAALPGAEPARHKGFELHPLFRALVVVMDRPDWEQEDVLLVRTGDDRSLRCGPIDFDPLRFSFHVDDDGNTLRGTFAKVMKLVMDLMQREDEKVQE